MSLDLQRLDRTAQQPIVQVRRHRGSPPQWVFNWQMLWGAKVEKIEINIDKMPSTATISFPDYRWQQLPNLYVGDMIRVISEHRIPSVLFVGVITNIICDFSGGEESSSSYEHSAIICHSGRFVLATTSPIFGQPARSVDNYVNYNANGTSVPRIAGCGFLSGRRAIFNEDGRPNADPELLLCQNLDRTIGYITIFADINRPDAIYWTAREMIVTILNYYNASSNYLSFSYPANLPGLSHPDWNVILNHICIEGLDIMAAVDLICSHLGWNFRADYFSNNYCGLQFFNSRNAGYGRSINSPIIRHWLHAPAAGENIAAAVQGGAKMLWAMSLLEDITPVINAPIGLGAIRKFEVTVPLIPAWYDDELNADTSEGLINLFLTNADLQEMEDKDFKSFYRLYHTAGADFFSDVGRKWALNETARYTGFPYDRGSPFNLAAHIPAQYAYDQWRYKNYAPFTRQLLDCLTVDYAQNNSIGKKVEFSLDFGVTWQVFPANFEVLSNEGGLRVLNDNLSEIVDKQERDIVGGPLNGIELNYWTSLCDDVLNNRIFKNNAWRTRVRVTAVLQHDQRLWGQAPRNQSASISPFIQAAVYNMSDKYKFDKRSFSSKYFTGGHPVDEIDDTSLLTQHLRALRYANEEISVSGQFVLDWLWLGEGTGFPTFAVGDVIEGITGRNYLLGTNWFRDRFPQIVQIQYLFDKQKTKLLTRDMRFGDIAPEASE